MPVTIVVGGQYGGEGKGNITAYLALKDKADILVKTGGSNSAHYFGKRSDLWKVRMMPSGSNFGPQLIVFPPGCLIHPPTLFKELNLLTYQNKIIIDPNAGIIKQSHIDSQQNNSFYNEVGSTKTGTGAASADRSRRTLTLAKNEASLKDYITDTAEKLFFEIKEGKKIIVEGCQSFGLSNYHGDYPYVTSRDTTAGALIGQIGIGFKNINCIIQVIKCFPTRNQGGYGKLSKEINLKRSPYALEHLKEMGGGSYDGVDSVRRVALFDFEVVEKGILANTPDILALTGLDRLKAVQKEKQIETHYGTPKEFIRQIETRLNLPVALEGWGPFVDDIVDKRVQE